jgi:glycosyltransferase involved in cell wall biosynthesis
MSAPLGRITGCVITRNEEGRIRACLESLSFCDELVVVDSHSTDRTREIAAECGARVIERDWPGYRSQKQFAVDAAAHEWILFLDADERVSTELAAEIAALRSAGTDRAAFRLPFRSIYFGRELRFGDAARETHVRLFDRRSCRFAGHEIHEKVEVAGTTGRLRGTVLHDSYRSLEHQLTKLATYAHLMGEAMHAQGRRGSVTKLLLNPLWRFVRGYLFRLGMLDGWRGLAVSIADANYVRQKYLHLLVLSRTSRRD